MSADQQAYVTAEVRRFWATTLIPVTAVMLVVTIALVLGAVAWTSVDPAVAIPAGSTAPWAVIAGIGFWTLVALAAGNVSFVSPTGNQISLGALPMLAAAALGGPLVAAWIALVGSTELRELRERPPVVVVSNHLGIALPLAAVALLLEPLRPSLLDGHAAVLSFGISLATGVLFLAANTWFALWDNAMFDVQRVPAKFMRQIRAYTALVSLLPGAWLAAEMYVHVGWWTVLVFASVLVVWQVAARQDALYRDANQDRLTSLLNRRGLESRLAKALHIAKRRGTRVAVAYLDLDGFKLVNDRYGHDAGDMLLMVVAERLSGAVRSGDSIGRIGGDEFVVVLPAISSPDDLALVVTRLRMAVAAPCEIDGRRVSMVASIGVALSKADGEATAETLLAEADAAMYREKASHHSAHRPAVALGSSSRIRAQRKTPA